MQHDARMASTMTRLLAELMPVSVVVAGPGADVFADALEAAGASAVTVDQAAPAESFDLAVLLAEVDSLERPQTRATIGALAALSERLLFVPTWSHGGPEAAALTAWFEPLAELGYQPVVDFDAQFVARGAFLVDRSATAAESDLANFADRVSGGAGFEAAPQPSPDLAAPAPADDAIVRELAEKTLEIARLRAELAAAQLNEQSLRAAVAATEAQNAGWDGLRTWVTKRVLTEPRGLHALRAARAELGHKVPRGLLSRHRPTKEERKLLEELALLRACPLFDPAWYVASLPDLARSGADPLLHFLLVGGPEAKDPGPWFETAAYLQANPKASTDRIPLLHAIRMGSAAPPPMADAPS